MPKFIGLKVLNGFSIGCIGSGVVFLPMFYKNVIGLSTDKVGLVWAIAPFVGIGAFPYWTSVADRTRAYKRIMITNMSLSLLSMLSIALVPSLDVSETTTLLLLGICNFGLSFFGLPVIVAMVDSVTLQVLAEQKSLYGQQKSICPIGFGLAVFMCGIAIDWYGQYAFFAIHAMIGLGFLITVALVDFRPYHEAYHDPYHVASSTDGHLVSYGGIEDSDTISASPDMRDEHHSLVESEEDDLVLQLKAQKATIRDLITPSIFQLLLVMGISGISLATIQAFLLLFVANDLHGTPTMIGLFGPLGSSTEIVCFYFFKEMVHRLGFRRILNFAQALVMVRYVVYMIVPHIGDNGAWIAMMIQPLHGIWFSLLWSSAVVQADMAAPKGLQARAQGLINMVFNGFGAGMGSLLSGYLYERYGAQTMWLTALVLQLLGLVLYSSFVLDRIIQPLFTHHTLLPTMLPARG